MSQYTVDLTRGSIGFLLDKAGTLDRIFLLISDLESMAAHMPDEFNREIDTAIGCMRRAQGVFHSVLGEVIDKEKRPTEIRCEKKERQ